MNRVLVPREFKRGSTSPLVPWSWRADPPALAGLVVLAGIYTWMRVIRDPNYFRGDIVTQFLPYYSVVGDRIRAGDIPGWNPAIFGGMPLAGDPLSGWGYLPVMLLFPFFSSINAYQIFVAFHLVATAGAAYLLGRALGMGQIGGFATGSAYLMGPQYGFTQCCTARMQLVPWLALAMAGVALATQANTLYRRIIWWGLTGLAFSQMIAGYFGKGFYYGIIATCAFLAYQVLLDPGFGIRQRIVWLVIHSMAIIGLGAGFGAVALLPRLDFLGHSNLEGGSYRSAGKGTAQSDAWPIRRTLETILNPRSHTYYLGAITVVFAAAAIALAGRRCSAPFFAAYAVVVLTLTAGTTPLHHLFYIIPKFKTIHEHQPHRILTILNIVPATLTGISVTAVERGWLSVRRLLLGVGLAVGVILAAIVLARPTDVVTSEVASTMVLGIAVLLVLTAALLCARRLGRQASRTFFTSAAVVIVLLLVVELDAGRGRNALQDGWSSPPTGPIGAAYADREDAGGAGAFLRAQQQRAGPFRYFGYDAAYLRMYPNGGGRNYRLQWRNPDAEALLVNNRAMLLGLSDIQGYTPAHPMNYVSWMDAVNGQPQEYHETDVLLSGLFSPLLNLLNVRYIVVPAVLPPARPDLLHLSLRYPTVYANSSVRVLENTDALPRAWLVSTAEAVPFDETIARLESQQNDPRLTVLLEPDDLPVTTGKSGQPGGLNSATIGAAEPDLLKYRVVSEQASFLIASEPYDPGWRAYLDGKSVPLLRADGILRAVLVPSGTHEVELRYEPLSMRLGIAISITTALLWIVALIVTRRFDRRSGSSDTADHRPLDVAIVDRPTLTLDPDLGPLRARPKRRLRIEALRHLQTKQSIGTSRRIVTKKDRCVCERQPSNTRISRCRTVRAFGFSMVRIPRQAGLRIGVATCDGRPMVSGRVRPSP